MQNSDGGDFNKIHSSTVLRSHTYSPQTCLKDWNWDSAIWCCLEQHCTCYRGAWCTTMHSEDLHVYGGASNCPHVVVYVCVADATTQSGILWHSWYHSLACICKPHIILEILVDIFGTYRNTYTIWRPMDALCCMMPWIMAHLNWKKLESNFQTADFASYVSQMGMMMGK